MRRKNTVMVDGSKTSSSRPRNRSQRKARFSSMAAQSLRNEGVDARVDPPEKVVRSDERIQWPGGALE